MDSELSETNPSPLATEAGFRRVSIGLPAGMSGDEKRFPLTPEAVKWLIDSYDNNISLSVVIEKGAACGIHYTDARYTRCGASVSDHAATLRADIVITVAGLAFSEISRLRRGAGWLPLLSPECIEAASLRAALKRHITVISLVKVTDASGNCHIADTLAEVDGRAAIAVASGLLADSVKGKGILLGGIAGIVPCEVIVTGAGIAGTAAAKSAIGLGATVRVFDDDPAKLRYLSDSCNGAVITSSLHREVFLRAVAKADIIVNTLPVSHCRKARLSAEEMSALKKGVIIIDTAGSDVFPSVRHMDLSSSSTASAGRVCFTNTGNAVPRTASMAVSNCMLPILEKIISAPSAVDPIKVEPGLKTGLVAISGQVVNREAATATGLNFVDPSIYLHLS